jgi:hypothetical protein
MKKNNILFRILLIDDNRTVKTEYTYAVDVSGEYVIYAGKNHKNITDEIVVEHVCDMTQSGTIEQKR